MIHYVTGDLLKSDAQALVNTVNTVGVMGKGIALQFREAFPNNFRLYCEACKNHALSVGHMLVVNDVNGDGEEKTIINFPTKTHWRLPSEYEYVRHGLKALRQEIVERRIRSIAIPPLGSRNGGLDWARVRLMMEEALNDLDCDIYIYEPSQAIVERLKAERCKLTPARAMILAMFSEMWRFGEFASIFAAEKLIYFMQRFGARDIFKIEFRPYIYGPYSGGKVAHLLYSLNGSFISGMSGMDSRPFDFIWLSADAEHEAYQFLEQSDDSERLLAICDNVKRFLDGFYSNHALELLSSVDYLLNTSPVLQGWRDTDREEVLDTLTEEIARWSQRKELMFNRRFLSIAFDHIKSQDLSQDIHIFNNITH